MSCNSDFVQYIIDQCSGAGEIAVKKMMGDYCAYCEGDGAWACYFEGNHPKATV